MTSVTIRVTAANYDDEDDCLSAAAREVAAERGLEGWDLDPRWEDPSDRHTILLTVPGAVCDRCGTEGELGAHPGEGHIVPSGGESRLSPYTHGLLCDDCADALMNGAREQYHCRCGSIDGSGVRCAWEGSLSEMVVVEYMPQYLREAHDRAGNFGVYPGNGAERVAVHWECATRLADGWCVIRESLAPRPYAEGA